MAPGKNIAARPVGARRLDFDVLARAQAGHWWELALLLRRCLTGLDVLVADAEHAAVSDQIAPDQVAAVSALSA
ncbi:MAG: hypothetical protein HPY64_10790 [Anaerolineae bacterium]|nr:hypothetical protein [Anaerolineae bacterium]